MMEWITVAWSNPYVRGTLAGFGGGIVADLVLFVRSKDPGDWWGQWSFRVALARWVQLAAGGFLGALGVTV